LLQDAQNVTINGTNFSNQTLYILNATLAGQALINGKFYFVSVNATVNNGATISATSVAVQVQLNPRFPWLSGVGSFHVHLLDLLLDSGVGSSLD
jgi:hypothetical protein